MGADRGSALVDPWLLVTGHDGLCLFGFAVRHGGTGGLSWVLSTPVRYLDLLSAQARTRSGRRYDLGQCITVHELDEEAGVALHLLLDRQHFHPGPDSDARWLTACKMARHVGVAIPSRNCAELIDDLIERHRGRYAALRSEGRS